MILAIDVGNTNAVFGLFKGKKLINEWRCPTVDFNVPLIKTPIEAVIVASVVPSLDRRVKTEVRRLFGIAPFFVTAANIPEIKARLKNKKEIGADRVVNVLAAFKLYGGPAIVVDFGTATTFDVISSKGKYLGGIIAPGIELGARALHEKTAKLPLIEIKAPGKVIGNDTVSAMQSGLIFGHAALVEGMVGRLKKALGLRPQASGPKVIATGGLARKVCKYTTVVDTIDDKLTLKGLMMIGEMR
jgi:type III pantothenate kinase